MQVYDPYTIAGGFPAGLNTALPATELKPDETPDGYGFSLSLDGRLAAGTIPSGSAMIDLTKTIGAVNYNWHYNRLWLISGTTLKYGAPFYDSYYYPQKSGMLNFDEDSNAIIRVVPVMPDYLLVLKSTGGYILSNASDTRALFQKSDILRELALPAAADTVVLNGVAYVSNTGGLFAFEQGKVTEVTRAVRNDLTGFTSLAVTADFAKQYVICGSALVYEPATKKLFKYSSTDFRYTTRQFHLPDYAPIAVDRIIFAIEHGTTDDGTLTYQTRYDDEDWSDTFDVEIRSEAEKYTVITEVLKESRSVRKFQLRLTALSSNKYIKEIRMDAQAFSFDSYAT